MTGTKADEFIEKSSDHLPRPCECSTCGSKISAQGGVYLDSEDQPVCENHRDEAEFIAIVERGGGYFNNGIHPETGETQFFEEPTNWFNIENKERIVS